MPNYRISQYRRYHDSLVSEYFWQLENVMDVLRGRAQHQQRFKEATLSTVFSVIQNAGTIGSTVSAAGSVVLGFLGQYQESRRVEVLTPEHLSGQWEALKKMVEATAEKAVEQYRFFLERCSESDAVELGRVSAQRLWEYIPREKLSFTIENMLLGILKGKSGRWQDDWRNTGLTESTESKRQTAEGALKHAGIAYCDSNHQWNYALHPRDKDTLFPKYGFMVLPEIFAKARILEKRYIPFIPSVEQAQLLENTWSTPIMETIVEDSTTLTSSLTSEVAARLQQLETDWLTFCEWQDTVAKRLEELQTQIISHEVAIVEVKHNIVVQHEHLSRLQRNVMDISESRRFTYIPKPYFQPRYNLWRTLEQRFSQENSVSPIAIVGPGGMGKTSLISQWAEKQKRSGKYHSIRRMVMDEISIESSLVDLAHDLYVSVEQRKQEDWLAEISLRLKMQSWLIIWDNVENYTAIKTYLPYFTHVNNQEVTQHLVVTSRDTTCWADPIFVDTFSLEESIVYIEHQMSAAGSPWYNKQHAQILADRFEHHPLSLELAMGHVCLYQRPLDRYLAELEAAGVTTLNAQSRRLLGHERINSHNLVTLWQMGLANLSQDAISLLRLMSFISTEGVRQEFLVGFLEQEQDRCSDALFELRQHAFITTQKHPTLEKWKMHRLLQDVVREETLCIWKSDEEKMRTFLDKGQTILATCFFSEESDIERLREGVLHGNQYLTHVDKLKDTEFLLIWKASTLHLIGDIENTTAQYMQAKQHLEKALILYRGIFDGRNISNENNLFIAEVLQSLCRACQELGDYISACDYGTQALSIQRAIHGQDANHSAIAIGLHNLGLIYSNLGNASTAGDYLTKSLTMKRILYNQDTDNTSIATALISLGALRQAQGNYSQAKDDFTQALIALRAIFGQEANRSDIALLLNNLGTICQLKEDYTHAKEYFIHALIMQRKIYGQDADHPIIAKSLCNLATLDCSMKENYSHALDNCMEALEMQHRLYGKSSAHPHIAQTLQNLGIIYEAQKDYLHARDSFTQSLEIYRMIYGQNTNHLSIAKVLFNLASLYLEQNDYLQAQNYFMQVIAMQRALSEQNTSRYVIAYSLSQLGAIYIDQSDYSNAQDYLQQALIMWRTIYGQETNHSTIAGSLNNLGKVYQEQGDLSNAQSYYQQALTMWRTIHGKDENHSDIAALLNNLGTIYHEQGDLVHAQKYFLQSLEMKRALGGEDANQLDIAVLLKTIGFIYKNQGNYSGAREYFQQALTSWRTAFEQTVTHSEISILSHVLGDVCQEQGDLLAAQEYYQQALIASNLIYHQKENSADIARLHYNLGRIAAAQKNFVVARESYHQALTKLYAVSGQETNQLHIALLLDDLAKVCREQKDLCAAQDYWQKSLTIRRAIYGQKASHPLIATSLNNLGMVCYERGDYHAAENYLQQALSMHCTIHSQEENHPNIVLSLNNLGLVYEEQGDRNKALNCYMRVLLIKQRTYGSNNNHPEISLAIVNAQRVFRIQGLPQQNTTQIIIQSNNLPAQQQSSQEHIDEVPIHKKNDCCSSVLWALKCCGLFQAVETASNNVGEEENKSSTLRRPLIRFSGEN